jgi:hypothetical protein
MIINPGQQVSVSEEQFQAEMAKELEQIAL